MYVLTQHMLQQHGLTESINSSLWNNWRYCIGDVLYGTAHLMHMGSVVLQCENNSCSNMWNQFMF